MDFLFRLFDTDGFPPRWRCGSAWAEDPSLGWVHIVSDVVTWLAYLMIPIVLVSFARKRPDNIVFPRVFWLFCGFIFACGTVHLLEAVIFWTPLYRLSAIVKFATALVSTATVIALVRVAPAAITLPGLAEANRQLTREAEERQSFEQALQKSYAKLERSLEKTLATEARAKKAEATLRGMFDNSRNYIGLLKPDGTLIDVNLAKLAVAGVPASAVLDKPFWETPWWDHSPELQERLKLSIQRASSGEADSFEATHRTFDGKILNIDFSIAPIFSGNQVKYLLPEGRNVTNQKKLQGWFQAAVESAPTAMLMIDHLGSIVLVNSEAKRMFGYSDDELIHQSVEILLPEAYRSIHAKHRDVFFASPESRAMGKGKVLFGIRKDGSEFPVEIALNPVETSEGVHVLSVIVDITERIQKQRELQEYALNLERANQELEHFTYVASHDLKAPLRAFAHLTQWLEEDLQGILTEASTKHLSQLKQRTQRMDALLNDLLAYSRAGRLSENIEHFTLQEVVDNGISNLEVPADFNVNTDLAANTLIGHQTALETVIRNLIGNSIKHHDRQRGTISVTARPDEEFVKITVSDDGPGITREMHTKAFTIFQTLKPRDEVEGSGMGLAIVKRLIEAEGGEVWIEQNEPRGTCIHFTWPLTVEA